MRRDIANVIIEALRTLFRSLGARPKQRSTRRRSQPSQPSQPSTKRRDRTPSREEQRAERRVEPAGRGALPDTQLDDVTIVYSPVLDGDPDPGEVVWTWVPYEEDPTQGKDRPVIVIGRDGDHLAGVQLSSKSHSGRDDYVPIGSGPWDPQQRPSYAKIERILRIDPEAVRREGAVLDKRRFDDVIAAVRKHHRVGFR